MLAPYYTQIQTGTQAGISSVSDEPRSTSEANDDHLFSILLAESRTGEECFLLLGTRTPNALRSLLDRFDVSFWNKNQNRLPLAYSSGSRFSSAIDRVGSIKEALRFLRPMNLGVTTAETLLGAWTDGALVGRVLSREELETLLAEAGPDLGFGVLLGYIGSTKKIPVSELYRLLTEVTNTAGWPKSSSLKQRLIVMAASTDSVAGIEELNRFLKTLGEDGNNPVVISEVLKHCALIRPSDSFDLLASLATDDPAKAADAAFRALLAPQDMREAAARMKSSVREEFLSRCASQLWGLSPLEAVAFAQVFPAGELPTKVIGEVAANLLPLGAERTTQWLSNLPLDQKHAALSGTFSALRSRPTRFFLPSVAKAWLDAGEGLTNLKKEDVDWAVAVAAKSYGLPVLLKFANLVPAADKASIEAEAYGSVTGNLARRDPTALRTLIESSTDQLKEKLVPFVDSLASADYQAAMDWRQSTTDPAIRAALDYGLIGSGAVKMPIELRRELCLQRMSDMPDWKSLQPAVAGLVQAYAGSDPAQAFDILRGIPESAMRDKIVPDFVKTWAEHDPVEASEWLVKMPAGKTRDLAVKELVLAARDDPEMAMTNAAGISDKALRLDAARSLIEAWKALDPQWMGELLRKTSFPPEEQAELVKSLSSSK